MEFHSNIDFQQCTDCPTSTKLEGVQSLDALIRPKITLLDHTLLDNTRSVWLIRILCICVGVYWRRILLGCYCKGGGEVPDRLSHSLHLLVIFESFQFIF